jgi:hypothetical protein
MSKVGLGMRRGRASADELGEWLGTGGPGIDALRLHSAEEVWADLVGADVMTALRAVRRPSGVMVLTDTRLVRAAGRLSDPDLPRRAELGAAIADSGATLGAYLVLLAATGRSLPTLLGLAKHAGLHRREPSWLHRHLGMLDCSLGPAAYTDDDGAALRLRQLNPGTNHATAIVLMRVRLDPAFALWLTTGVHAESDREPDLLPFEQRFRAQQQAVAARIAKAGTGALGRILGAPLATSLPQFVNRFTQLTGARFAWFDLVGLDEDRRRDAFAVLTTGVRAGVPVPLALNRDGDRTMVLVLCAENAARLLAYDPAEGKVIALDVEELVRRPRGGGDDPLEGALLPRLLES